MITSPTSPTSLTSLTSLGVPLVRAVPQSLQCPASKQELHSSNLLLKHHSCITNLQQSQEYWGNPSEALAAG